MDPTKLPPHIFELHSVGRGARPGAAISASPWETETEEAAENFQFEIHSQSDILWVGRPEDDAPPVVVAEPHEALAGFRVVHRRHGRALAMLTFGSDILVNGRRALSLSMLSVKDSIVLGPDVHLYVTERVRPFHGHPSSELISKACPFCRLKLTAETTVVTCRCGTAYHLEPHPADVATDSCEEAALRCFEKVQQCLSCGRGLTTKEYLEWDPQSAW